MPCKNCLSGRAYSVACLGGGGHCSSEARTKGGRPRSENVVLSAACQPGHSLVPLGLECLIRATYLRSCLVRCLMYEHSCQKSVGHHEKYLATLRVSGTTLRCAGIQTKLRHNHATALEKMEATQKSPYMIVSGYYNVGHSPSISASSLVCRQAIQIHATDLSL